VPCTDQHRRELVEILVSELGEDESTEEVLVELDGPGSERGSLGEPRRRVGVEAHLSCVVGVGVSRHLGGSRSNFLRAGSLYSFNCVGKSRRVFPDLSPDAESNLSFLNVDDYLLSYPGSCCCRH
jgi:hypothetical protein